MPNKVLKRRFYRNVGELVYYGLLVAVYYGNDRLVNVLLSSSIPSSLSCSEGSFLVPLNTLPSGPSLYVPLRTPRDERDVTRPSSPVEEELITAPSSDLGTGRGGTLTVHSSVDRNRTHVQCTLVSVYVHGSCVDRRRDGDGPLLHPALSS